MRFLTDRAAWDEYGGRRSATRLQMRGDVNAITKNAVAINHHVTHMDAHAKVEPCLGRLVLIAGGHALLHRGGAGDRIDHRREFSQKAVAHGLDHAAAMQADQRLERAEMPLVGRDRARFVAPGQGAVAGDVGDQNGGKPAFRHLTPQDRAPLLRPIPLAIARVHTVSRPKALAASSPSRSDSASIDRSIWAPASSRGMPGGSVSRNSTTAVPG